jgi:hypothetical protein
MSFVSFAVTCQQKIPVIWQVFHFIFEIMNVSLNNYSLSSLVTYVTISA